MALKLGGENSRKKWANLMPIFILLVVIAEIAFLGRLDMAENAAFVNSWADSLFHGSSLAGTGSGSGSDAEGESAHRRISNSFRVPEVGTCERWLEEEDTVVYSRDFDKDPILISGGDQVYLRLFSKLHYFS